MTRPVIVVLSKPDDDFFNWCSDGWYTMKKRGTQEAERLMNKAKNAITAASDVPDAIRRLEEAGFEVKTAAQRLSEED